MPNRTRRATLYDVARRAGVSYQTVSRVINGSPHVAPKTLRRVQEAIKALDYQPNKAAQALVTRRTFILEVIAAGTTHYGPAQMVTGVEQAANASGYKLVLTNIENATLEQIKGVMENLGGIDGVIIIAPIQEDIYEDLTQMCPKPFVKVGAKPGANLPSVIIDQHQGSQMMVQHLIDLGHRHIAEICGPLQWYDAAARHESWLATLRANKLEPGPVTQGDWTAAGGYAAAWELLHTNPQFSALAVANDQMALGAMRALHECGLRIPDDISVTGFDDIPESAFFEPPLTTVRQDFTALGKQSVEYLVEMLRTPEAPLHQRMLYPTLVIRQSTRALK
jgi:LacI family transcriptional regulator